MDAIVLLGYMGCGKSTVGRYLSGQMECEFVDLDEYIATKEQMDIQTLFATKGEVYFRKKESEYLEEILENFDTKVLSLGGGTPCYADNMDKMMAYTPYNFYLQCSAKELTRRLEPEKSTRPLIAYLSSEELEKFIQKHLFERNHYYAKATHTIRVDDMSVDDIATHIIHSL